MWDMQQRVPKRVRPVETLKTLCERIPRHSSREPGARVQHVCLLSDASVHSWRGGRVLSASVALGGDVFARRGVRWTACAVLRAGRPDAPVSRSKGKRAVVSPLPEGMAAKWWSLSLFARLLCDVRFHTASFQITPMNSHTAALLPLLECVLGGNDRSKRLNKHAPHVVVSEQRPLSYRSSSFGRGPSEQELTTATI